MTGPDNNFTFSGSHNHIGLVFEVCKMEDGWYWVTLPENEDKTRSGGPYPTAEGAYLAAIGE